MKQTPYLFTPLDTDLYKPTVHQMLLHRYANVEARYEFTCRNADKIGFHETLPLAELKSALGALADLHLTAEDERWLDTQAYFKPSYRTFWRNFRLDPANHLHVDKVDGRIRISARGPVLTVQPFEVYVLATVNALWTRQMVDQFGGIEARLAEGRQRLAAKMERLREYNGECERERRPLLALVEFGTRRRASAEWQEEVIQQLSTLPNLVGTSNMYFARRFGLRIIGTFGHEWPMLLQGLFPVQHSQREAFKVWLREYEGRWGIALADTFTTAKFLRDFTFELAKSYDGVRHDSGDPGEFAEAMIAMYRQFGIDARTKRIVFSDGLTIDRAIDLHRRFADRIQVSFGIGTHLTNDIGLPVPSIVMKIAEAHGQPVTKLSNEPGKASCTDDLYLNYLRHAVDNYGPRAVVDEPTPPN